VRIRAPDGKLYPSLHGSARAAVALVLLLAHSGCGDRLKQDACLDKGGCWDSANQRCEQHDQRRCAPAGKADHE
jgi:hypothetical protein